MTEETQAMKERISAKIRSGEIGPRPPAPVLSDGFDGQQVVLASLERSEPPPGYEVRERGHIHSRGRGWYFGPQGADPCNTVPLASRADACELAWRDFEAREVSRA